jgi:hypothetical protein
MARSFPSDSHVSTCALLMLHSPKILREADVGKRVRFGANAQEYVMNGRGRMLDAVGKAMVRTGIRSMVPMYLRYYY